MFEQSIIQSSLNLPIEHTEEEKICTNTELANIVYI